MKIISCHIENFGKLSDFTMDFADGKKNTICKENGWGKSTLAAFIKVMLYGFDNEGKRDEFENERKRFKPWQGGVYGGQLIFEAGGKTYEASRVFAAKDKDDIFVLKYTDTGLESKDYSEKLGEELFGLDSKSFMRSIFVSQDACETSVTDGISAKLGNLTDSTDDINNYEKASVRLNDIINSISPKRKTGEASRQKEKITELKQIISQGQAIEESLNNLSLKNKNEREAVDALRKEQEIWSKRQQELSRFKDIEIKKKEYERLSKECLERKEKYEKEISFFKNGLPEKTELNEKIELAYSLAEKKSAIKIYELTDEEEYKLNELEDSIEARKAELEKQRKSLKEDKADSEEQKKNNNIAGAKTENSEKNKENITDNKKYKLMIIKNVIYLAVGLICLAVVLSMTKSSKIIVAIVTLGMLVLLVELFINIYNYNLVKKYKDGNSKSEDNYKKIVYPENKNNSLTEKENRIKDLEKLYEQDTYIRNNLLDKKNNHLKMSGEYVSIYNDVKMYLNKLGFEPEDDMYRQLDFMEEKSRDIDELKDKYDKICKDKELFEINNDIALLMDAKEVKSEFSLSEIDENLRRISRECDEHNKNITGYGRQIDELEEKLEYIAECENELELVSESYEANKHKYKMLEYTRDMLEEARAAFTAKYTAPIKQGFDKYYNMITGSNDNTYRLDANINLSHKELGLDRDTKFLSMGYKDLVGVCMRMALVDAMYEKEKPFIIFDDSFVNLDKDKLEAGLRLLDSIAKEYQIIYFTCHESRV
mgnify:CR=1 FL=1